MKDQGMPLGEFRFGFTYGPCSQELRARLAALNVVTGAHPRHWACYNSRVIKSNV